MPESVKEVKEGEPATPCRMSQGGLRAVEGKPLIRGVDFGGEFGPFFVSLDGWGKRGAAAWITNSVDVFTQLEMAAPSGLYFQKAPSLAVSAYISIHQRHAESAISMILPAK